MIFQVRIDNDCYVVDCYFTINRETTPRWHPLRKFSYEGDAKAYKNWDCPEMGWGVLEHLANHYDPNIIYQRLDKDKFLYIKKTK